MNKITIFIIGLIITILGLDFFIKSGFYSFLDTIFYPVYDLKGFFSQSIYWHFMDIMTIIFGYELYSKIYMIIVLAVGAILGLKLGTFINKLLDIKDEKLSLFNKLLGVVFILFNPFIYERLVTQTGIALGVFFIGLGFIYLLVFLLYKKDKNLYLSSLFLGLSLTIFPHSIIFVLIIIIFTLLFFIKSFNIKKILISLVIFSGINLNLLYSTIFNGSNNVIESINTFNQTNIEVFTSNSLSNLGVEITHLLGYGFWGEKYRHLYTPDLLNEKWYIAGFIILFIIILGFIYIFKLNKKLSLYLLVLAVISYILSLGISSNIFLSFNELLYKYIPYYIGMREPAKLLGFVAIIYSIFFLIGIYHIKELINKTSIRNFIPEYIYNIYFAFIIILLFIFAWSPNMLFGFKGQLKIINYPNNYFEAREYLISNNSEEKNIILPWHSYMGCDWTYGKIIANPLPYMLKPINTISADNIEIGNLYTNSKNEQSKKIEEFLKEKDFYILKELGINNIIFQKKCADFSSYKYLEENENLEKSFSGSSLDIYKIK